MNTVTKAELSAGMDMLLAVAEAVREAGKIPAGHVYAVLQGRVDLAGFNKLVGILEGAGVVKYLPSHELRWVGPQPMTAAQHNASPKGRFA